MTNPTQPPETADLLNNIETFIGRFVIVPGEAKVALSLFVLHTHAFDAAHATPYGVVISPDKQSGKTRLMEVMALLSAKAWHVSNATPAAIYRKIERDRPTLFLDEIDTIFTKAGEVNDTLTGVLNAGNRPSSKATRCAGQDHEPTDFSVYCPKVMAGIDNGALPDTIRDRSITIHMQRKLREETVEKLTRRVEPEAEALKLQCEAWALAHLDALAAAEPDFPEGLSDRQEEAWEALFAIADLAGGEWPERARHAATTLHGADTGEENLNVRVLGKVREVFGDREQVPTEEILRALNADETLPVGDWHGGRGMTSRELADHLRPFGPRPLSIRQGSNANLKGYKREEFSDAWARYLAPACPQETPHPPRRHSDDLSTDSPPLADWGEFDGKVNSTDHKDAA